MSITRAIRALKRLAYCLPFVGWGCGGAADTTRAIVFDAVSSVADGGDICQTPDYGGPACHMALPDVPNACDVPAVDGGVVCCCAP